MSILIFFVGILFLVFSMLQINDPDSYFWVLIYLIPSLCSFIYISINNKKYIKYSKYLGVIYLVFAVYLYFFNNDTIVMHIFSETINEVLGLILCAFWLISLNQLSKTN